jgi:hypothetical protein
MRRIMPFDVLPYLREPGLIGYECPKCTYVTSELVHPDEWPNPPGTLGRCPAGGSSESA